jgi:hypothetical protein
VEATVSRSRTTPRWLEAHWLGASNLSHSGDLTDDERHRYHVLALRRLETYQRELDVAQVEVSPRIQPAVLAAAIAIEAVGPVAR